ncbi:MAG TPA: glucose-1-phosphate adenylyltransferase [Quisquiliibacterium sp.]|nr:glucose-1-phosphate adenylyltransferase [Quisquiliibacterium sp.]
MNGQSDTVRATRDDEHPRFVSQLTRNTYAMVLAGGRGSRLHQLTDWRAKPAVPFAGKFRIIDFTLSNCVNSGVRRIGVATQYKAQSLIRHIQRAWSFLDERFSEFIDVMPAQQQIEANWYQGTADAVFQNLDALRHNRPEFVLVLSGDHVYKMDYGRLLAFHVRQNADLTVACVEVPIDEARGFGVMGVDDTRRVVSFVEKPDDPPPIPGRPDRALANMGVYVFNARFLYEQLARDADDPRSSHDFGKDVIPHCVSRYRVFAQPFSESSVGTAPDDEAYWRDVGTIDAYWGANMELTKVTPELNLYDEEWPIWTHQEQTPPAKFVFDDENRRGSAIDSMVAGGTIISGATVRRSMLFTRVRVHSFSLVEDSVLLPSVEVERNCVIRRAVIDKRCRIPEGTRIGVDPDEDRRRFHVSDSGVVLVTAEMLGQGYHRVR